MTFWPGPGFYLTAIWIKLLTLMLLVATLVFTNVCENPEKWLKPWHMGTHLRVLSKGFPMNTNLTGFRWFSTIFASLCFGRKQPQHWKSLKRHYLKNHFHPLIIWLSSCEGVTFITISVSLFVYARVNWSSCQFSLHWNWGELIKICGSIFHNKRPNFCFGVHSNYTYMW